MTFSVKVLVIFAVLGGLSLCPALSYAKSTPKLPLHVSVDVFNDAAIPPGVVDVALSRASMVFRRIGIEPEWILCSGPDAPAEPPSLCHQPSFPENLQLRLVSHPAHLEDAVLGLSFLGLDGVGFSSDVFYGRVETFAKNDHLEVADLLGYVAAHELGHLLLGSNSHSVAGVMCAHWTSEELIRIKQGGLFFSDEESRRMRNRLMAGTGEAGGNVLISQK